MSEVKLKSDPTDWVEFVLERFVYNYKSETVHWKSIYSEDGCGSVLTGFVYGNGYRGFTVCGKPRRFHHIVWILTTGAVPKLEIDHIDGDRAHNSHTNLREVDKSANMHNNSAKGYSLCKATGRWQARTKVKNRSIHLGYFKTEQEARAAYEAAKKLHGFIHR
jgi:hypothetical protein